MIAARARTHVRESAYVISDPEGDPGIRSHRTGLSTPTTAHHREKEGRKEEERQQTHYCAPNDTRPACARDIVARRRVCVVVVGFAGYWGDSMRFYLADVNRVLGDRLGIPVPSSAPDDLACRPSDCRRDILATDSSEKLPRPSLALLATVTDDWRYDINASR